MSALGSLVVKLALEYAEYTKGLSKSDQEAVRFAQNVQRNFDAAGSATKEFFTGVAQGAIGAVAAYASVSSALSIMNRSINEMDQIDELSEKLAVDTTTLQEFAYAGKMSGVELEGMAGSIKKLQLTMAEAITGGKEQASVFKAIGVSVQDADGNLRDSKEVMLDVADVFGGLEDGALKTSLAVKLFGKQGAELVPFLSQGAAGIRKLTDEANALGGVLSGEQLKTAAEFNDNLDRMGTLAGAAAKNFTADFIPAINDVIKRLIEAQKESKGFMESMRTAASMTLNKAAGQSYDQQIANLEKDIAKGDALRADRDRLPFYLRRFVPSDAEMAEARRRLQTIKNYRDSLAPKWSGGLDGEGGDRPKDKPNAKTIAGVLGSDDAAEKKAANERKKAEKEVYDAVLKAAQARSDLRNAEYEGIEKYLTAQEAERVATVKAVNDAVEAAQLELDMLALTRSQIEQVTIMRLRDKAAALEVGSEARNAIEQEIEARDKLSDIFRKGEARDGAIKAQEKIAAESQRIWENFGENVQRNVGDVLYNGLMGKFDNIGDVFKAMLARMAADAAAANLSEAIFGAKGSSGGGWLGAAVQGLNALFGGGPTYATGGYSGSQWSDNFAKGGAFFRGMEVTAFADGGAFTNTVATAPTMAPMALFGEAGPEAIMPLTRGPDGSLGVRATGGGRQITISPTYHIQVDSRTDRAEVERAALKAAQRGNAQLMESMKREGVV